VVPSALQVCTPLFEHCLLCGVQTAPQTPALIAPPCHVPVASQVCGTVPLQRVAVGVHTPAQWPPEHAWFVHGVHATPPVPHAAVVSVVRHVLPLQQPLGQLTESHCVWQVPPRQMRCEPHEPPSFVLVTEPHTGPFEHDMVPIWQGLLFGLHGAFAVHATQLPALQTPVTVAEEHCVPSLAATIESVHVGVPPAHEVTVPVPQGLPAGVQGAPVVQALHAPE
jgi:hypothetical protein